MPCFQEWKVLLQFGQKKHLLGTKRSGFCDVACRVCQIIVQGFLLRVLIKKFDEIKLITSGFISLILGFSLIPTENIYLIPLAIVFLAMELEYQIHALTVFYQKNQK